MDTALAHVHDPRDRSLIEIKWIALGISAPSANQRHIGLLYRDDSGFIMMLHLQWHHQLGSNTISMADGKVWSRDEVTGVTEELSCLWIAPEVLPEIAPALQQLCKVVSDKYARKKRSIAYALRYEKGAFDPASGEFLTEYGHGLTCATFVLALFASYGVQLVSGGEWIAGRDAAGAAEDRAWQELIVRFLREYLEKKRRQRGIDAREIEELEAHIAAVEGEIGCARFRPEEVAAAGTVATLPAGFAHAEPVGRGIVEKLRQRFPPQRTG